MPTRLELATMSKAELYELATAAEIEGRSTLSKAELVAELADDDRTPGLDPKLAKARDELREREAAETAAIEDRSGPPKIDEALVAARRRAAREDAASARSVRRAPNATA